MPPPDPDLRAMVDRNVAAAERISRLAFRAFAAFTALLAAAVWAHWPPEVRLLIGCVGLCAGGSFVAAEWSAWYGRRLRDRPPDADDD